MRPQGKQSFQSLFLLDILLHGLIQWTRITLQCRQIQVLPSIDQANMFVCRVSESRAKGDLDESSWSLTSIHSFVFQIQAAITIVLKTIEEYYTKQWINRKICLHREKWNITYLLPILPCFPRVTFICENIKLKPSIYSHLRELYSRSQLLFGPYYLIYIAIHLLCVYLSLLPD